MFNYASLDDFFSSLFNHYDVVVVVFSISLSPFFKTYFLIFRMFPADFIVGFFNTPQCLTYKPGHAIL